MSKTAVLILVGAGGAALIALKVCKDYRNNLPALHLRIGQATGESIPDSQVWSGRRPSSLINWGFLHVSELCSW